MKAIRLATDGTHKVVELISRGEFYGVLEDLRTNIGCRNVDAVRFTDDCTMWIDDDGYDIEPVNIIASAIAREFGFRLQNYYGVVVITGGADDEGNTLGLTDKNIRELSDVINVLYEDAI